MNISETLAALRSMNVDVGISRQENELRVLLENLPEPQRAEVIRITDEILQVVSTSKEMKFNHQYSKPDNIGKYGGDTTSNALVDAVAAAISLKLLAEGYVPFGHNKISFRLQSSGGLAGAIMIAFKE